MTKLGGLIEALADGLNFIKETTDRKALAQLGIPKALALKMERANKLFWGPTSHTRYQQRCRKSAELLDVHTLLVIAEKTKEIKGLTEQWKFCEELCAQDLDADGMRDFANARIKKIQPKIRAEKVAYRRHSNDMSSVTITAKNALIEDLRAQLTSVEDVEKLFDGGLLPKQKGRLLIVATAQEVERIFDGEEISVRMTNGAVISSKELLERTLDDEMYSVLFDPIGGPIDAFRSTRFATFLQRLFLAAKYPTCVWDDCRVPFSECEIHHVHPYAEGGDTNLDNEVPVCKHHNGVNDDKREGRPRGYLKFDKNGTIYRAFADPKEKE
ncbi:HNH endonuclease signature motif containing protein [Corynebacterium renale]|nr:HNH endonuclease signature motif containing protein [Corynebacterium renale]